MTVTRPFLLVRTRVGLRTRLVEVTCSGDAFRLAAHDGVHVCPADDVTATLLEPFAHATAGGESATPTDDGPDADVVVIGCCDELTTPCLVATRRDGVWHDTAVGDDVARDWFDVRAEVVAALVGLHVQSTAFEARTPDVPSSQVLASGASTPGFSISEFSMSERPVPEVPASVRPTSGADTMPASTTTMEEAA